MRKTLLASATLFGLAFMPAAFARNPPPDQSAPVEAAPPPAPSNTAPAAPKPHHHHAKPVSSTDQADSTDGQHWAHQPGTGESGPASTKASNIDSADSRSAIAPHFPEPAGGENAGPWHYLHDAEHALAMKQTGMAQQALEMAETRLLDRSTPVDQAGQPDQGPLVQQVSQARQALGHGDLAGARSAIQMALSHDPHAAVQGGMAPSSTN